VTKAPSCRAGTTCFQLNSLQQKTKTNSVIQKLLTNDNSRKSEQLSGINDASGGTDRQAGERWMQSGTGVRQSSNQFHQ